MREIRLPHKLALAVMALSVSFTLCAGAKTPASHLERPVCKPNSTAMHCYAKNMKQAVKQMQSRDTQKEINQVVARAEKHLNRYVPSPEKVVIADLDETLLNNAAYYVHHAEQDPASWSKWLNHSHNGPYNQSVYHLLKAAQTQGFSVMYITGRPASLVPATLRQTGDIAWNGVFHKPVGVQMNAEQYKSQVREMLKAMGYMIVLNIGDQVSDHDQPVDESKGEFLLPNVMYTIP